MSTATERKLHRRRYGGPVRCTKIYDEHGKHISTRDSCTGNEWPTLADDEEVQPTQPHQKLKKRRCFLGTAFRTRKARNSRRFSISSVSISACPVLEGRCAVAIIEPLSGKFSPLVCSWFENDPQSDIKKWVIRFSDVERRINVGPEHPLYPQVKAAYEAQEAHSNSIFEAAKKRD
ncbi:hypothetical protein [Xylella fastidiosa]|uniref:hypothetical protein n=1 Tax=Xylella fastidiosa TaxID=2371 RepID=UPI0039848349